MLGLEDLSVFAAWILCVLSALLCVLYGIKNWNTGRDSDVPVSLCSTSAEEARAIDAPADAV